MTGVAMKFEKVGPTQRILRSTEHNKKWDELVS